MVDWIISETSRKKRTEYTVLSYKNHFYFCSSNLIRELKLIKWQLFKAGLVLKLG